jgi:hypothetical protein
MRTPLKTALLLLLGALLALPAVPEAQAADLGVTRVKKARVHIIRHRSAVFRDYDGTPIVLRRYVPLYPVLVGGYHGTLVVRDRMVRTQVVRSQPSAFVHPPYISCYGYP